MNRRVAPTIILVVITIFILLQAAAVIYVLTSEGIGIFLTVLILLIPLAVIAALMTVYIERIREIDEEEKDDLSKY